jgi:sugar (pentulose or hexulose) kinase
MTRTEVVVGVDMGTTRVKALAVDLTGAVRGEAERRTPWRHDGGRAEVDPIELSTLGQAVAASAVSTVEPTDLGDSAATVLGVGVTGMAETGVLVDAQDRPLAPAIAWHDPRGEVETIARQIGRDVFQATTGLPLSPLPSLGKLLWLRRHVSDTKSAARFYSVGEWVVRRLGGAAVAELSLASRTGLLELERARPWDAAFGVLGCPPLLGEPVVAGTPVGTAHGPEVPESLVGAVLTVAGHDHQTASYGVGAAADGALFDSLGTAEGLVRTVRPPLPAERVGELAAQGMSVGWGVIADHLCILAGLPTGLTLDRVATMVGATSAAERARLGEQALQVTQVSPLSLVDLRYEDFGLAGITDGVTPAALWRSVVDALAARSARTVALMDTVAGRHRQVVVAGGWLHNPAVLAAKRRQYPVMRTTGTAEPGAYGAALLAAGAAGRPISPQNER